jgi:putative addiction module killer protein
LIGWRLATPETQLRSDKASANSASTTGAGYRVYFVQRGEELVLLLCGGDKNSQASDIAFAEKLASELED